MPPEIVPYGDLPCADSLARRAGMLPPPVLLSTPTRSAWDVRGRGPPAIMIGTASVLPIDDGAGVPLCRVGQQLNFLWDICQGG